MTELSTAPYDGREVANFLLDYADARKVPLTQISILKILYFCHGWYLFYKGKPLIKNDFEAWENGPIVRAVRDAFKVFGKEKVTARAERFDLITGEIKPITPALQTDDAQFIQQIFDAYYIFTPWELRDITHEPGSPWDKLWNSRAPVARFGLRIKNEEITAHFSLKAQEKSATVIKS
jgi:uncharacterized phage-associated protein